MAQTYTFTPAGNSTYANSTLGYGWYSDANGHWNAGTAAYARQGYASSDTSGYNGRVGFMIFTNAGSTLQGKAISNITLAITTNTAGLNIGTTGTKTITFKKSLRQTIPDNFVSSTNKGTVGSTIIGDTLGSLTDNFYNNTKTITLNASTNATLFTNLSKYLTDGNSMVLIHSGETAVASGASYSSNYLAITSITITVTYDDAAFIWYNDNGTWVKCAVWYKDNGTWVKVQPYYKDNGTWTKVQEVI